jgi:superoxide oxidase
MSTHTKGAAQAAPSADARLKFDPLSMAIHWTTVVLVIAQFATAWSIDHVEPSSARLVLTLHRSTGVALWTLVVLRLVWRATGMRAPPLPASTTPVHRLGVKLSEYALYLLLLVQPVTGMLDSLYRGRAFALFVWTMPALVHRDRGLASLAHTAHEIGAFGLAALVGLHAAAALFHHLILKDGVLLGMLPVRSAGGAAVRS